MSYRTPLVGVALALALASGAAAISHGMAAVHPAGWAPASMPKLSCQQGDISVTIANFAFSPPSLTIQAGQTVCWSWSDPYSHTVTADDGSFDTSPPMSHNTFRHTFASAGSVGYHCAVHGSPGNGMYGTITVQGSASHPGTLALAPVAYAVAEAAGSVTLTVGRSGGSDGAVSASYATGGGSAVANVDYTPSAGTLTWASGDSAPKTIAVAIADDGLHESNETFQVTLSSPTGGATLGAASATVTLLDSDDPATNPGTLALAPAAYAVTEAAGSVTLTVVRTGGSDGPVSASYATGGGSAVANVDYTPTAGVLTWASGDSAPKTIAVAIADDGLHESNETFQVTLSSPTGGATLGAASATVTLLDSDDPAGSPPAAPTGLHAAGSSPGEIDLQWVDGAHDATSFRIERALAGDGPFTQVASIGTSATTFADTAVTAATIYYYRVRAVNSGGASAYTEVVGAATDFSTSPCVVDATTLCMGAGRFEAKVHWMIPDGTQGDGQAVTIPGASESGLFYFFSPTNLEMLIKVLDACIPSLGNRFWVFYGATTNVEFTARVRDTKNGRTWVSFNPLNRSAPPVQDVSALATCP